MTSLPTTVLRVVICFAAGIPFVLLMFIISKRSHYAIVLVFRTIVPAFLANFYLFGLSKQFAFKLGLANTDIVNDNEVIHNGKVEGEVIANVKKQKKAN